MFLKRSILTLLAVNTVGVAIAVGGDLAGLGDALTAGSQTSVPLPILAAYVIGGLLLAPRRGAPIALLAATVSLAAAASDGDVGHAGLSAAQVVFQLVIVAATIAIWGGALAAWRGRPSWAQDAAGGEARA